MMELGDLEVSVIQQLHNLMFRNKKETIDSLRFLSEEGIFLYEFEMGYLDYFYRKTKLYDWIYLKNNGDCDKIYISSDLIELYIVSSFL